MHHLLTQTEAVGAEREPTVHPAWRAVRSEGDSPEGGGREAGAGGRTSPTF